MADFHLLLYLYKCDVVPLKVGTPDWRVRVCVTFSSMHLQEATLELCSILREKDASRLSQWRLRDPWVTVDHLIRATGG